ncbi:MAG: response regulator [Sandaracinaceae bacterium]
MDKAALTKRLRAVFVEELEDHVSTWNDALLRLEQGAPPADLQRTLFRIAHSLKGAARAVSLPTLETYCHGLEEELDALEGAPEGELLGRLFAAADVWAEVARRLRADEPVEDALFAPRAPRAMSHAPASREHTGGLRVPAARLDALLVRAGELSRAALRVEERERETASLAARLRRLRAQHAPAERRPFDLCLAEIDALHGALLDDATELTRVARDTDADVRQLRLTPFGDVCVGLERTLRDAALAAGREVELIIEGADVEVDRSVLTALRAPLLHLARNAVAHGIEPPAVRAEAGKPRAGRVRIGAHLRGSEVEVSVSDDGRGLDLEALAERAREHGIDPPETEVGLARLVFVAGLTTSDRVDALAGRGVGLDVVKTEVEALHGTIDVETQRGGGTTFSISSPLTRTLVRVLLVRAAEQLYALPTPHVLTLRRVDPRAVHRIEGRPVVLHEGEPLPFTPLARTLGMPTAVPDDQLIPTAIVQAGRDRVALSVDELRSVDDVVVESLGERLPRVRGFGGATILPNGEIALILHGGDVVRAALRQAEGGEVSLPEAADLSAEPPTLLVVDDSLTTLALEKTILESAGYRVLAASDAERALRLLDQARVDLVVSDVEMPRMSGLELTRALRGRTKTRGLPVVLLTALSREEDRRRGLDAGADAYLVKNAFDQTELLEVVASLLSDPLD